jgi:hypothetical protein
MESVFPQTLRRPTQFGEAHNDFLHIVRPGESVSAIALKFAEVGLSYSTAVLLTFALVGSSVGTFGIALIVGFGAAGAGYLGGKIGESAYKPKTKDGDEVKRVIPLYSHIIDRWM